MEGLDRNVPQPKRRRFHHLIAFNPLCAPLARDKHPLRLLCVWARRSTTVSLHSRKTACCFQLSVWLILFTGKYIFAKVFTILLHVQNVGLLVSAEVWTPCMHFQFNYVWATDLLLEADTMYDCWFVSQIGNTIQPLCHQQLRSSLLENCICRFV